MSYENIEKWERPNDFLAWTSGAPYDGEWYVFISRHRDSSILDRSNFERGLELIGGESETVMIVRESHWGFGWVEWVAIHESNTTALNEADGIKGALYDYPVVDDMHYSQAQFDAIVDYWQRSSVNDRMHHCHEASISVFAARHDTIDQSLFDYLMDNSEFC